MKKAVCIGLGTIFIFVMIFLWNIENEEPIEKLSIDYIIENIETLEPELNQLGYKAYVAYTYGDINNDATNEEAGNKLGFNGRGILILVDNNEKYQFDVGFDSYKVEKDKILSLIINKRFKDKSLNLSSGKGRFPLSVSLFAQEYHGLVSNDYNLNFTKYRAVFEDECFYDRQIKKYISEEDLVNMIQKSLDLQTDLINLYHQKTGNDSWRYSRYMNQVSKYYGRKNN